MYREISKKGPSKIVGGFFSASVPSPPILNGAQVGNNPITTCTVSADCSGNSSKKKCWKIRAGAARQCVECHRNNQCVVPGRMKCNKQTFTCEDGSYIKRFMTKNIGKFPIADMDGASNKVEGAQSKIADLYANTRYFNTARIRDQFWPYFMFSSLFST